MKMMTKKIIAENKNRGVIHIDITHNEKETNQYILNKVIKEWQYATSPADMKEGVNYGDDYEKENSRK